MRYVMFNLMVVGALAFLLFDGAPPTTMPTTIAGAVDKIAIKAKQMVDKGKALVEPARTQTETQSAKPTQPATPPTVVVERVPEPQAQPVAAKPAPVETAVKAKPPAPVANTPVAEPARPLPPAVAKRRAEILGETVPATAATETPAPAFMTPRVRRGELAKLAEDMELLFVEKVNR